MKAYPLTEAELLTLGAVQGGSALLFAAAGALFGFYLSVDQTIAFADAQTAKEVIAYWKGLQSGAFWGSIAATVVAAALFGLSGWTVFRIKNETDHD